MKRFFVLILALAFCGRVQPQVHPSGGPLYGGLLAPARATDAWPTAGVLPTVRNNACATQPTLIAPDSSINLSSISVSGSTVTGNTSSPLTPHLTVGEYVLISGVNTPLTVTGAVNVISNSGLLTSSTSVFNSSMIGDPITIAGAGVGGAALTTTIVAPFISGTQVNFFPTAVTSVTGATVTNQSYDGAWLIATVGPETFTYTLGGTKTWPSVGPAGTVQAVSGTANGAAINAAVAAASHCVVNIAAGTFYTTGISINVSNFTFRGASGSGTTLYPVGPVSSCITSVAFCVQGAEQWIGNAGDGVHSFTTTWTSGYTQGATAITLGSVSNLSVGQWIILDQENDVWDYPNIPTPVLVADTTNNTGSCGVPFGAPTYFANDNSAASTAPGRNVGIYPGTVAGTSNVCANGKYPDRNQAQMVQVTQCGTITTPGTSCTAGGGSTSVVISPGLYMPNWRTGQNPGAYWAASTIQGVGIENFGIDYSYVLNCFQYGFPCNPPVGGMGIINAVGNWVTGVASAHGLRDHIWLQYSAHNLVESDYFYQTQHGLSESYGIEPWVAASDNRFDNNIFQQIAAPHLEGTTCGNVFSYNFGLWDFYSPPLSYWLIPTTISHDAGNCYNLHEGNIASGQETDTIHGTHNFGTDFRNYYNGVDSTCVSVPCTLQTLPINLASHSRYWNIVNNVLGTSSYHLTYESSYNGSTCPSPTNATFNTSIYSFGFAATQGLCDTGNPIASEQLTESTAMRWGNFDTVSNLARFCTGTGTPSYCTANVTGTGDERGYVATSYPALQTPSTIFSSYPSLYLASSPSFWQGEPFPGIGSELTGGNVGLCSSGTYAGQRCTKNSQCGVGTCSTSSLGGRVSSNPAMDCYLNTMNGPLDGTGGHLSFNAANCYPAFVPSVIIASQPNQWVDNNELTCAINAAGNQYGTGTNYTNGCYSATGAVSPAITSGYTSIANVPCTTSPTGGCQNEYVLGAGGWKVGVTPVGLGASCNNAVFNFSTFPTTGTGLQSFITAADRCHTLGLSLTPPVYLSFIIDVSPGLPGDPSCTAAGTCPTDPPNLGCQIPGPFPNVLQPTATANLYGGAYCNQNVAYNGTIIPQTSASTTIAPLIIRSTMYQVLAGMPEPVCDGGLLDNTPEVPSTANPRIDNADCTGTNMYYDLGMQNIAGLITGRTTVSINTTTLTAVTCGTYPCAQLVPLNNDYVSPVLVNGGSITVDTGVNQETVTPIGAPGSGTSLSATISSASTSGACTIAAPCTETILISPTLNAPVGTQIGVTGLLPVACNGTFYVSAVGSGTLSFLNGGAACTSPAPAPSPVVALAVIANQSGLYASFLFPHPAGTCVVYNLGPSSGLTFPLNPGACGNIVNGTGLFSLANGVQAQVAKYNYRQYMPEIECNTKGCVPLGLCSSINVTSNATAGVNCSFANGPDHVHFQGLAIAECPGPYSQVNFGGPTPTSPRGCQAAIDANDLIILGGGVENQTTPPSSCVYPPFPASCYTNYATHIHFRDVWMHGDYTSLSSGVNRVSSGITMGGCYYCSMEGSKFSMGISPGSEVHAASIDANTIKMVNNSFEGQSSSMFAGGSSQAPAWLMYNPATDAELRRNIGTFPYSWLGTQCNDSVNLSSSVTWYSNLNNACYTPPYLNAFSGGFGNNLPTYFTGGSTSTASSVPNNCPTPGPRMTCVSANELFITYVAGQQFHDSLSSANVLNGGSIRFCPQSTGACATYTVNSIGNYSLSGTLPSGNIAANDLLWQNNDSTLAAYAVNSVTGGSGTKTLVISAYTGSPAAGTWYDQSSGAIFTATQAPNGGQVGSLGNAIGGCSWPGPAANSCPTLIAVTASTGSTAIPGALFYNGFGDLTRKNGLEIKQGARVIISGFLCENVDNSGGQNGICFADATRSISGQPRGQAYNTAMNDITVTDYMSRNHCNDFADIGGRSANSSGSSSNGDGSSFGQQRFSFLDALGYHITQTNPGCSSDSYGTAFSSASQTWNAVISEVGGVATAQGIASIEAGAVTISACADTTCTGGTFPPHYVGTIPSGYTLYNLYKNSAASNATLCGSPFYITTKTTISGTTLTAPAGTFSNNTMNAPGPDMTGAGIVVAGAGPLGADLITTIASVQTTTPAGTTVTLTTGASVTPTNPAIQLNGAYIFIYGYANANNNSAASAGAPYYGGFQCVDSGAYPHTGSVTESWVLLANASGVDQANSCTTNLSTGAGACPANNANPILNTCTSGLNCPSSNAAVGYQVMDMYTGDAVMITSVGRLNAPTLGASPSDCNSYSFGASGQTQYVTQTVGGNITPASVGPGALAYTSGSIYGTAPWLGSFTPSNAQVSYDWSLSGQSADNTGLCVISNVMGSPKSIGWQHMTFVSDASTPIGQGASSTRGSPFIQNASLLNDIFVSPPPNCSNSTLTSCPASGWYNSSTNLPHEGGTTEFFNYDYFTLSAYNVVWPGRNGQFTQTSQGCYVEFGNNPSFPDPDTCTGTGCLTTSSTLGVCTNSGCSPTSSSVPISCTFTGAGSPPALPGSPPQYGLPSMFFPATPYCSTTTPNGECVGFVGMLNGQVFLTLPDYHGYELCGNTPAGFAACGGNSSYFGIANDPLTTPCYSGPTPCTDNADIGARIQYIDAAFLANIYKCTSAPGCSGPGPFPDNANTVITGMPSTLFLGSPVIKGATTTVNQ
jgi:hypothetical protein